MIVIIALLVSQTDDIPATFFRVPREVEIKVTEWVRFQSSEELNDSLVITVNHYQSCPCTFEFAAIAHTRIILKVISFILYCHHNMITCSANQKRKVLSDSALPSELRVSLARSLRHDLFMQVTLCLGFSSCFVERYDDCIV